MTTLYCPHCAAEVEDRGNYCLLGHPLVPRGDEPAAAGGVPPSLGSTPVSASGPERPATVGHSVVLADAAPVASQAAPRVDHLSMIGSLARQHPDLPTAVLAGGRSRPADPITSFAPAPRMDWGPEHSRWGQIFRLPRKAPAAVDPSEDSDAGWARELGEPHFVDAVRVPA